MTQLPPNRTILFADMTGTLLMQESGGFPDRGKHLLLEFLNKGGELNVVTGDSFTVTAEHFLEPLLHYGQPRAGVLRTSTLSGYRLDEYHLQTGSMRKIHEGIPVPASVKHQLLDRFAELFRVFGKDISAQVELLKEESGRIDIAAVLREDKMDPPVYLESVENKVTLFFTQNTVTQYDLFRRIVEDERVKEIARCHGLHMMELYCCLDIISTTKGAAIDQILSLYEAKDRDKRIIVMGDSRNDAPMFLHPFPGFAPPANYYLGENAAYFTEVEEGSRGSSHWLRGRYSRGAYEVLERIDSDLTR